MSRLQVAIRVLAGVGVWGAACMALAADFTVAYQTTVDPAKVAQAGGAYEKATGADIAWRKFDAGNDVITALASGDVQIGYLGSSPLAAATSRQLPVETFLIATQIGSAEALVAREGSGINTPQDLIGKKVAVPFASTGHYSLLAALKNWGIDPRQVTILNLAPPAIIAAWKRGDIDATYVWDPALGVAKENGTVLITSGDLAKQDAPTFDAWVVRKDFAAKHPEWVKQFAKVTLASYDDYHANPSAWAQNATNVQAISQLTGAKPQDITVLLQGNAYPAAAEQKTLLGAPTVTALTQTAQFLHEQKRIDRVLDDYRVYVSDQYLPAQR